MNKFFIALLLIIVAGVSALFISLTNSDIEDVIICASDNDAYYIPEDLCRYYLYNYRGSKEDIEYLQSRAGLGFVFGISDRSMRRDVIQFLIAKGLSVNGISNFDGLTPLHAAILLNEPDLVQLLIESGADKGKKAENGMDAMSFLALLEVKNPDIDRKKIRQLLSK